MSSDPRRTIEKVYIEEGCISCSLCQDIVPQVFLVNDGEDCVIKEDARAYFEAKHEEIHEAAEDCPVEVIKVES